MLDYFFNLTSAFLLLAALKFKPGITLTVEAPSSIDTVMIAAPIAARTLIYIWNKQIRRGE